VPDHQADQTDDDRSAQLFHGYSIPSLSRYSSSAAKRGHGFFSNPFDVIEENDGRFFSWNFRSEPSCAFMTFAGDGHPWNRA
jgi:hypothetical protein